jgi:hypothetical protein
VLPEWLVDLETWMSPNKSDVTCKWLEPMVYDEKTMHFFMEIQVTKVHLPELFCSKFVSIIQFSKFLC